MLIYKKDDIRLGKIEGGSLFMGKKSVKEDKNIYFQSREEAGLTRAEASELMEYMTESKLVNIEMDRTRVYPDDVIAMAKVYKKPELCNYYCKNQCEIGREYIPEIKEAPLAEISLGILASINNLSKQQQRLIEITADGQITEDEYPDFIKITKNLDELSLAVNSLKLWVSKAKLSDSIDASKYDALADET